MLVCMDSMEQHVLTFTKIILYSTICSLLDKIGLMVLKCEVHDVKFHVLSSQIFMRATPKPCLQPLR